MTPLPLWALYGMLAGFCLTGYGLQALRLRRERRERVKRLLRGVPGTWRATQQKPTPPPHDTPGGVCWRVLVGGHRFEWVVVDSTWEQRTCRHCGATREARVR